MLAMTNITHKREIIRQLFNEPLFFENGKFIGQKLLDLDF
jgi:hypothetical protein